MKIVVFVPLLPQHSHRGGRMIIMLLQESGVNEFAV